MWLTRMDGLLCTLLLSMVDSAAFNCCFVGVVFLKTQKILAALLVFYCLYHRIFHSELASKPILEYISVNKPLFSYNLYSSALCYVVVMLCLVNTKQFLFDCLNVVKRYIFSVHSRFTLI